ncbi:hypothetical protein CNT_KDOLBLKC_03891 [Bacillus subtilis]
MAKFKRGKTWSYHIYLGIDTLTKKTPGNIQRRI